MNPSKIVSIEARRWNGLMLGMLVVTVMHLSAATNAGRGTEPWPALLSADLGAANPAVTLLQQRASGTLDRLVQAAAEPQPL